jgi:hypothetical protein
MAEFTCNSLNLQTEKSSAEISNVGSYYILTDCWLRVPEPGPDACFEAAMLKL